MALATVAGRTTAAAPVRRRLTSGWQHHRGSLAHVWEVWRPANAGEAPMPWDAVELPHCFNARDCVDPDTAYYQGQGWYRTHLPADNPFPGGRTLLHFEGAGQKTTVYVFEDEVARHVGGYDEFTVDVTDAMARAKPTPQGIPVAILCDNGRDREMIPSNESDFSLYGGLYRSVNLVHVPAVSIERVLADATVGDKAQVRVRVRLHNPKRLGDEIEVKVELHDPKNTIGTKVGYKGPPWTGERELGVFTVGSPQLWSPASPTLYQVVVTLQSKHGQQQVTERVGFRSFEFVKQGPFKLNGQRLLLRGTHRHVDHAGLAAALPEEVIRKELTLMKEMGVNFIRLGHYQQSRVVLELCDELGILVWEEIPWCRGGLGGPRFKQQARDMLRAMIDQHRNHPAVILWGLGNENDWKPGDFESYDEKAIRAFMVELNQLAHAQDPSRKTCIRRCEFCKDVVDVYSPSIWAGWYRGQYTEYKSSSEAEMKKVNHFLHVEWGGDSHARRHAEDPDRNIAKVSTGGGTDERGLDFLRSGGQARASRDGDWSESYICNLFDWHLKEQETMDWLTGTAQWVFKDFCTPLRPDNPVPRMNQKGVVERDLTPKEAYYVFQSYWTDKPMARLYGHSWPIRWGAQGEAKMVKVYSNCASAELYVNGVSQGSKQRQSQDFPAAGLRWMVKLHPGANKLKVVARAKTGATVTDEITQRYQTQPWGKPARLVLEAAGRSGDLATVRVRCLDAKGVLCLDARNVIRFGLTGDGRLIDNLGTSTGSRQVELWNGMGQISVALNRGQSAVSVTGKDLGTAFVTVK
ncbi:MAG TPA: glycoside hydrolase family 2 TIM barrel-domain containing protein [Polyangia bacterium]|nr:glycoside hydrolase family 2 TIM barrel-domain containing protein [Polyangia bacterium]